MTVYKKCTVDLARARRVAFDGRYSQIERAELCELYNEFERGDFAAAIKRAAAWHADMREFIACDVWDVLSGVAHGDNYCVNK